jgi:hypothetical protein
MTGARGRPELAGPGGWAAARAGAQSGGPSQSMP